MTNGEQNYLKAFVGNLFTQGYVLTKVNDGGEVFVCPDVYTMLDIVESVNESWIFLRDFKGGTHRYTDPVIAYDRYMNPRIICLHIILGEIADCTDCEPCNLATMFVDQFNYGDH